MPMIALPAAARIWLLEATCSYNQAVTTVGIRELKNNLSEYVRQVERGRRVAVTSHGRVVAELVPPGSRPAPGKPRLSRDERLVAEGLLRLAAEDGDPLEGADVKLPPGSMVDILDWTRGER